jgi:hypothetical protein
MGRRVPKAVVGQANRDRNERMDEADCRQGTGHGDRDDYCHQPGKNCEPSGPLTEQPELELVTRQEEQEPEAQVGYQQYALGLGPRQDLRPDENPPRMRITT